jgi:hypothetical protein
VNRDERIAKNNGQEIERKQCILGIFGLSSIRMRKLEDDVANRIRADWIKHEEMHPMSIRL